MFRIDENLCTGCGACVATCPDGAISMRGCSAVIDQTRCTSCGACADVCLSGAVAATKTGSSSFPRGASADPPEALPQRAGAPILLLAPPPGLVTTRRIPSPRVRASRLDKFEKVLSGVLGFVGFALEVRRNIAAAVARSDDRAIPSARTVGRGSGRAGQRLGPRAQGSGRVRGAGARKRGGPGGRHTRKHYCGTRGRDRAT